MLDLNARRAKAYIYKYKHAYSFGLKNISWMKKPKLPHDVIGFENRVGVVYGPTIPETNRVVLDVG